MKKLLTAALTTALGLAVAGPAQATETRINSLSAAGGLGGAYNEKRITIRDSANIDTFPQFMVTYKNSVDVDNTVGSKYGSMNIRYALSDDPAPPVIMLFGKQSPWQPVTQQKSILGRDASSEAGGPLGGNNVVGNPISNAALTDATNHQFGIGFGMKAGESVRLGATLSLGGNRADTAGENPTSHAATDDEQSNTWVDFNFGIGFDINEVNSLDFGLNIMAGSFTNMNGNTPYYAPNGLFGVAFTAKGEFMVSQIAKIVPYLRVNYDSRSVVGLVWNSDSARTNLIGTVNNTWLHLGTDLAIAPPNMEGVLIQPGIGLIYHGSTVAGNAKEDGASHTVEDSNNIMPWYGFAAEAKAFEWLFLRLGARQVISRTNVANTETSPKNNETHFSTVTNKVSTGFGIKLMGWHLDLDIDPEFFNRGIYAVSGNSTAQGAVKASPGSPAVAATATTPAIPATPAVAGSPATYFALNWALGYDW